MPGTIGIYFRSTMGVDPKYYNSKQGFNERLQNIKEVKPKSKIPIMLSPVFISQYNRLRTRTKLKKF